MKKHFYFFSIGIFFCLSINTAYAQNPTPLLSKEAFNFAVGDTFVYNLSYTTNPISPTTTMSDFYYEWVIKELTKSSNKDTLLIKVTQKNRMYADVKRIRNIKLIAGLDSNVTKNIKLTLPDSQAFPFKSVKYKEYTTAQDLSYGKAKKSTYSQLYASHTAGTFLNQVDYAEGIGMVRYLILIPESVKIKPKDAYQLIERLVYFRNNKEKWGNYPKELVGTKETAINFNIALYPNPVQDVLQLKNNFDPLLTKYEILDMQGTLIRESNVLQNNSISVSDLPKGMYILQISNNSDLYVIKFIKN